MNTKIFNIISGAKSGALNIAVVIGDYLTQQGYQVETILRKYNKTDLQEVIVVKDRYTFDYIKKLAELIKQDNPQLIIVHGYSTHIWTKLAVAYANIPVKVIHVEHNVEKYTILRSWLLQKLDDYTDQYICVSKGVAAHLLKQGVDHQKVAVIYNGIDVDKFNIAKEPHDIYTIGMVARFTKQKDQITLIKAVEYLIKVKKTELRLILLGNGKTKRQCEAYVESAGLQDAIIFKTGQFIDIIPQLDLFVLATHYEGFGLVVCEAMAAKIPVVATDVPGVDEIITNGQTGYLVEESNCQALVDKILYCMEHKNQEIVQNLIEKADQELKEKFCLEKMCDTYSRTIGVFMK